MGMRCAHVPQDRCSAASAGSSVLAKSISFLTSENADLAQQLAELKENARLRRRIAEFERGREGAPSLLQHVSSDGDGGHGGGGEASGEAGDDDECAVCLEPLEPTKGGGGGGGGDDVATLVCGHRLHAACLAKVRARFHAAARAKGLQAVDSGGGSEPRDMVCFRLQPNPGAEEASRDIDAQLESLRRAASSACSGQAEEPATCQLPADPADRKQSLEVIIVCFKMAPALSSCTLSPPFVPSRAQV